MRVLVRQQSPAGHSCVPVCEVLGWRTVLTRLVVLQAFAADRVTHGKEKIIVIVVVRVEKLLRFNHEVLVVLQFIRRDLKICGLIGEDIEIHRIIRPSGQIQTLEVERPHKAVHRPAYSAWFL